MNNILDDDNINTNESSSDILDSQTIKNHELSIDIDNTASSIEDESSNVDSISTDKEAVDNYITDSNLKSRKHKFKSTVNTIYSKITNVISDIFETKKYMDIFVRAFSAYFIVTLYNLVNIDNSFDTLDFPRNVNMNSLIIHVLMVFIILTLVKYIVQNLKIKVNTDGYFLAGSIVLYGLTTVVRHMNVYYAFGVSLVISICLIFLIANDYFKEFATLTKIQSIGIVAIFGITATVFISAFCIYRYLIFASSCFDLGIFAQMYYNLVHTLLPDTTCERNEFLSHFAVHVSPIYYLLVPIYAIFQSPKTLLVCQAIIVESGVIPLYLICKKYKFSNASTMAMSIAYIFSPAYITACFYDFHENVFLVPLILWILWAMETNHIKLMYLFSILTLFVKEDAFIYVVCIFLFVITSNKKYLDKNNKEVSLRWHGILITAIGVFYFAVVNMLMDKYGLGIMQYHYNNIMIDPDSGIINLVVTSLLDPALAISECFTEGKFIFFLEMTLPLMFLPFASKKISHLFLLIPFFLVNLISGNGYQNQLGYQYVFGVMSLLVYASVLNLAEMKTTPKKYAATVSMCVSMVLGTMFASDKLGYYDIYCSDGYRINCINSIISLIPDDASVECTTYYVPQLSQREEIYMMSDPKDIDYPQTDFILIRPTEDYYDERVEMIMSQGYQFYDGYEDYVYLFVKNSYLDEHPEIIENLRNSSRKNY